MIAELQKGSTTTCSGMKTSTSRRNETLLKEISCMKSIAGCPKMRKRVGGGWGERRGAVYLTRAVYSYENEM